MTEFRLISFLSIIFILLYMASLFYQAGVSLPSRGTGPNVSLARFQLEFFQALSICGAAYFAQTVVLPVFGEMKHPHPDNFKRASRGAIYTVGIVYWITGLFAYMVLGDDVGRSCLLAYLID